jgi:hypothetical protein
VLRDASLTRLCGSARVVVLRVERAVRCLRAAAQAEDTHIQILPRFSTKDAFSFISVRRGGVGCSARCRVVTAPPHAVQGSYGPFRSGIISDVPLWLAIRLKSEHKCTIVCPTWLTRGAGVVLHAFLPRQPQLQLWRSGAVHGVCRPHTAHVGVVVPVGCCSRG